MDKPKTHTKISSSLVGEPIEIISGEKAVVRLVTTDIMRVDDEGLVHGGFTFGLADYAAMLAVNHPYVVLYKASVSFLRPVKVGDILIAEAKVSDRDDRRVFVKVHVYKENERVFEGDFLCVILNKHVLDKK